MINEIQQDSKSRMEKTQTAFEKEMEKVRTGRASQSILDGIKVNYYGSLTILSQMSTISIPESRLIAIKPWDLSVIDNIEKSILKANIGLTPSNDGKLIRISIPPLTEERRKEIVKNVSKTCEDYRVAIRNIRRDANDMIKDVQKQGDISEDESFKAQKQIQELTDDYIKKLDQVLESKEKEILEV